MQLSRHYWLLASSPLFQSVNSFIINLNVSQLMVPNATVANDSLSTARLSFEAMLLKGIRAVTERYPRPFILTVDAWNASDKPVSDYRHIDFFQMHLLSDDGRHILEENRYRRWPLWKIPRLTNEPLPPNSADMDLTLIDLSMEAAMGIMNRQTDIHIFDNVTLFSPINPPVNAPSQIYYVFRYNEGSVYVGTQNHEAYHYESTAGGEDGSRATNATLSLDSVDA